MLLKVYLSAVPYQDAPSYMREGVLIPVGEEIVADLSDEAVARLQSDKWIIVSIIGDSAAPKEPAEDPAGTPSTEETAAVTDPVADSIPPTEDSGTPAAPKEPTADPATSA